MLIVNKDGRKIRAMIMDTSVDRCRGIVQCGLPGCEAHMALVEPGTPRASGNLEEATPSEQVTWFLEHHACTSGHQVFYDPRCALSSEQP